MVGAWISWSWPPGWSASSRSKASTPRSLSQPPAAIPATPAPTISASTRSGRPMRSCRGRGRSPDVPGDFPERLGLDGAEPVALTQEIEAALPLGQPIGLELAQSAVVDADRRGRARHAHDLPAAMRDAQEPVPVLGVGHRGIELAVLRKRGASRRERARRDETVSTEHRAVERDREHARLTALTK